MSKTINTGDKAINTGDKAVNTGDEAVNTGDEAVSTGDKARKWYENIKTFMKLETSPINWRLGPYVTRKCQNLLINWG